MIRRIVKLMLYIKAPVKAFVLFHPVRAAKLWFAYVLGSALFGASKRAAADGAVSGWGEKGREDSTEHAAASGAAPPVTTGGGPGSPDAPEAASEPVTAGASVPEGHQSAQ